MDPSARSYQQEFSSVLKHEQSIILGIHHPSAEHTLMQATTREKKNDLCKITKVWGKREHVVTESRSK